MTQPPQPPGDYGQQPPESDGPALPPPKKSKAGVIAAVIIGAVLVLAGGGIGVYFLAKGGEDPNAAPAGDTQTGAPGTTQPPGSGSPEPTGGPSSGDATRPPEPSGGGDDARIIEVVQKYAEAVTDKNETAAKEFTCENDAGLLYSTGGRIEVVGGAEIHGEETASVNVKITVGSETIDNFPLLLNRKGDGWCVSA